MDDGVFWQQGPQGLYAARVAAGGPGDKAGVRIGDTVLAVDGEEALEPRRPPGAPGRQGAGGAAHLFAAPRRRAARGGGGREAALQGQRHPLLLPVAGRVLQPAGGHDRHAAAAAGPRRAALLRHLPALLPDVLDLVHREAQLRGLDPAVGGPPLDPVPARRLPALLPVVPRAAAVAGPGLDDPRRLHARPRPGRRGGGHPGAVRDHRQPRRALAHHHRHRPLEAALLRPRCSPSRSRPCSTPTARRAASPRASR